MDCSIKLGSCMIVSGPAQSGKTTWILNFLRHKDYYIDPVPSGKIYWHYGEETKDLPLLNKWGYVVTHGLPRDNFESVENNSIVVIDDLMRQANMPRSIVTDLFTMKSHHKNLLVIYVQQNLFDESRENRIRQSNAQYLVLFPNVRDTLQISILGRQMYPSNSHFFVQAYKDATRRAFGYLLIDFVPRTPDKIRLRSNVLWSERPMIAYTDPMVY